MTTRIAVVFAAVVTLVSLLGGAASADESPNEITGTEGPDVLYGAPQHR